MKRPTFLLICFLFFSQILCAQHAPVKTSSDLHEMILPDVEVVEVELFDAKGSNSNMGITVKHTKVSGLIGGNIGFELLLPDDWNGRFFMGGGGGYVGSVMNGAIGSINDGYATAGTDTGHQGSALSAEWALNDLESQLNFGYMAVHRTAEVSKSIINLYYGQVPEFSYFDGASRGGGQALMEAVRYPDDFDGIVAGCPAQDWSGFSAKMVQNMQAVYPDPDQLSEPVITEDNLKLLEASVLKACDELDGVRDGIMMDPSQCPFDLDSIPACPDDVAGPDCLTIEQREAIRTIYEPLVVNGTQIYPGQPFGSEGRVRGWKNWIVGINEAIFDSRPEGLPSLQFAFGIDYYKYIVFQDPEWDYSSYDFTTWKEDIAAAGRLMDSTSTDLSAFKAAGGKLIVWHGWSDPALSALQSIEYFEAVQAIDPNVQNYYRLFLMPGVLHGSGGPGPDKVEWRKVITQWVEKGVAPDQVTATKYDTKQQPLLQRPLCPYPQSAVYNGTGDSNKAENFTCNCLESKE